MHHPGLGGRHHGASQPFQRSGGCQRGSGSDGVRGVAVAVAVVVVLAWTVGTGSGRAAEGGEAAGWQVLFDGRTLEGWRANEAPGSFRVEDGVLVARGPRSHLFYEGPVEGGRFRDFEFSAEVLTRPGANSGIYFHTAFQERDWLARGYEVQINNTATGDGGYRENKKTGSLYGVRNVYRQVVGDDQWFTLRFRVEGRRIAVFVNDLQTVDYVEPDDPPTAGYRDRRLSEGTFALQCHDPGSEVRFRNVRVRVLKGSGAAGTTPDPRAWRISRGLAALQANNVPVIDLHTHLKGGLTLEDVLRRQYHTGINAGIAINGGLGFAVTNDATAARALEEIRHPLMFTALQAEGREWRTLFSREMIGRFDYVFTDAMTLVDDQGRRMRLWIPEEVTIGDPEDFMEMLVDRTVAILENEPIDVWVNPTFLPAPLDRRHEELWTQARMERVIGAAVRNRVAIEINDRFQLPGPAFIRLAKAAGARFTLGTNNGGREDLGMLGHAATMVEACGLDWQDFWVPGQKPGRARSADR